jgi:hypothetical protein
MVSDLISNTSLGSKMRGCAVRVNYNDAVPMRCYRMPTWFGLTDEAMDGTPGIRFTGL